MHAFHHNPSNSRPSFSWLAITPWLGNYSFVRACRAFRALRTLRAFPQVRSLMTIIFRSIRGLADVLIVLVFTIVVFAVIGIDLFAGLCLNPHNILIIGWEQGRSGTCV